MFRLFLKYAFYPVSLVGSVAVAYWLIQSGAPLVAVVSGISVFFIVTCFVLELKFAENPSWRFDAQEMRSDVLHATLSNTLPTEGFRLLFYGVIVAAAGALEGAIGFALWPDGWPILVQLAMALLITEFVSYWIHRSLHTVSFLWPLHAIHHCSRNYYCLIGLRKHPLQVLYTYGIRLTVLWLIGVPAEVMALYTVIAATNSMIQHSNIEMRFGWLNWILATPEIHRWHHSKVIDESNRNYGDILIIWDVIFGTRILPKTRRNCTTAWGCWTARAWTIRIGATSRCRSCGNAFSRRSRRRPSARLLNTLPRSTGELGERRETEG
jgi:ornithine lipid hydroxylase